MWFMNKWTQGGHELPIDESPIVADTESKLENLSKVSSFSEEVSGQGDVEILSAKQTEGG